MIRQVVVGSALGALILAAAPSPPPASAGPAPVRWTPCAAGFACATVSVPLDYDRPRGEQISIALTRMRATDPARRIGSLVVNPGGPGLSGVAFVQANFRDLPAELRARFDIVGFDSRGLAGSTALRCYDTAEQARADRPPFLYPETPAEERIWRRADDKLSAACAEQGGPILDHMSSADVARDLERLRVHLSDRRLTYLGYSYGSLLGQTYANLFPAKFRALVIDGVIDPVVATRGPRGAARTTPTASRMAAADGAGRTLDEFFRVCDAAGAACAFSGRSSARFARLAGKLKTGPQTIIDPATGRPRTLSYNDLIGVALGAVFNAGSWPGLGSFLADVEKQLSPAAPRTTTGSAEEQSLAAGKSAAGEKSPAHEMYLNEVEGKPGVACSDTVNPRSFRTWQTAADRAERQYGYFGRIYTWVWSQCRSWPTSARQDSYHGPWTTPTAAPVLIVGNYFDPATPYTGAVGAARLLPNSRLLSYAGWGHVAFHLQRNSCVDAHVSHYLLTARPPAPGTVCRPDPPFPPSPAR
ncbi:alpha/beta hydrolase [Actinoplanes sp. NPDC048967]|uniref:alpha/beta hydrolase n=1 Tax=Actinoplanes sp. NPDC048967 TaxID=3155269 RepID=UPI00340A0B38